MEGRIPLGEISVPTQMAGVFLQGQIYLRVRSGGTGQPEASIQVEFTEERGFITKGDDVTPVKKTDVDLKFQVKGKGEVESRIGPTVSIGLIAYEVLGAGIEGFFGLKSKGEVFAGTDDDYGEYACAKTHFGGVVEGNFYVDLFVPWKKNEINRVFEYTFAEKELDPKLSEENCEIFQDLNINTKEITMNTGEAVKLDLKGSYKDLSSSDHISSKKIAELEKLQLSTSVDGVVRAEFKNNQIVLTAEDDPSMKNVVLTISYKESIGLFKKDREVSREIPITIGNYQELKLNGEWSQPFGQLKILDADGEGFNFNLQVSDGMHTGEVGGTAEISGEKAVFLEEEYGCGLTFNLSKNKISIEENSVPIEENLGCLAWHGAGIGFSGGYEKGSRQVDVTPAQTQLDPTQPWTVGEWKSASQSLKMQKISEYGWSTYGRAKADSLLEQFVTRTEQGEGFIQASDDEAVEQYIFFE
ncbi:hypothetical protein [[Bacillus] enclensis]|uniref:hypothetical protein n=1 Tax=[Bacillus] enclensis TaxID=1402860 RepID=UPI0018DE721F|nr:hypothetical protein [[Bacillus] enclensis]MBH9967928.1 hypothetical protein [[Bacillus] enclensis]